MQKRHWTTYEGDERATVAMATADGAWGSGISRRSRMREALRRYQAYQRDGDRADSYATPKNARWFLLRSMVAAIVARVGATQNPRIQCVTSGEDWGTRRKAAKLDRFADALALQTCPPFSSVHELRTACLQDAMVCGIGAAQVSADYESSRVVTERVLPWELAWDPYAARYGAPAELWRRYPMSRDQLREWYPDKEGIIDAATEWQQDDVSQEALDVSASCDVHAYVGVTEGWYLSGERGRHVAMVASQYGPTMLQDEEWTHDTAPIIIMRWDHPIIGGEGMSLSREIGPAEDEINLGLERLSDTIRRTSINYLIAPPGCEMSGDIEDAAIIHAEGGITPPQMVTPAPFDQSHLNWIELMYSRAYELSGLSQMAATGERQPGVSSGAAVRAVSAQQEQRFAWLRRQQDSFMIDWFRAVVHCSGLLAESGNSVDVDQVSNGALRRLTWKDVAVGEDELRVQVHPVGEAKNTPADRQERAYELFSAGLISKEAYLAATTGSLDVHREEERVQRQSELIDQYIDRMLDATEDDLAHYRAEGALPDGSELYPPLVPFLDLAAASVQVADAWIEAKLDGAPDANSGLLLNWLAMADAKIQELAQRQAELQQTAGGDMQQPAPGGQ